MSQNSSPRRGCVAVGEVHVGSARERGGDDHKRHPANADHAFPHTTTTFTILLSVALDFDSELNVNVQLLALSGCHSDASMCCRTTPRRRATIRCSVLSTPSATALTYHAGFEPGSRPQFLDPDARPARPPLAGIILINSSAALLHLPPRIVVFRPPCRVLKVNFYDKEACPEWWRSRVWNDAPFAHEILEPRRPAGEATSRGSSPRQLVCSLAAPPSQTYRCLTTTSSGPFLRQASLAEAAAPMVDTIPGVVASLPFWNDALLHHVENPGHRRLAGEATSRSAYRIGPSKVFISSTTQKPGRRGHPTLLVLDGLVISPSLYRRRGSQYSTGKLGLCAFMRKFSRIKSLACEATHVARVQRPRHIAAVVVRRECLEPYSNFPESDAWPARPCTLLFWGRSVAVVDSDSSSGANFTRGSLA
ncbi:hypothetical protein BDZ89DRAFT_1150410 [Hymenopellis radicata]|nr:hypothetical protein BDZ89DRAFT_1150410 [Hymenopellis radicata]